MTWWPRTWCVESTKNGTITVREGIFGPSVWAGGFEQSGPYLISLWRTALSHIPQDSAVQKVLALGLGGGSMVREVNRRYPDAVVTVIEWDEAMVEIAKQLHQWRTEPIILIGDACDTMSTIKEEYDLILVDIFYGDQPEPRLLEDTNLSAMKRLLAPAGALIMNISRKPEFVQALARHFVVIEEWRYKDNTCVLCSGGHGGIRTLA